jgi:succinate dehydrogenase/fumarate reductase iron-sulfur protein
MSTVRWNVTFLVYRQKGQGQPHYDPFKLDVDPDEYVLDGLERIWAFHDRSLCFRHACHHSTCGACGMRVNGVEKLTCITTIRSVTTDTGTLKVEPLRNFPVVSDLVVDMDELYRRAEMVGQKQVLPDAEAAVEQSIGRRRRAAADGDYLRLSDCIECGLCVSACPIVGTLPAYLGPCTLAGAQANGLDRAPELLPLVDSGDGVWRCHSVYECTEVCPAFVDPGRRIMDLRQQVIRERVRQFFDRR